MIKKIKKDGYTIEYFENKKYTEEEMNKLIDDSLAFLKHKEAKNSGTKEPILVYKDGTIVNEGDEVVDFRGDKAIVTGWKAPAYEGKSGRIFVKEIIEGKEFDAGYYPEVYGLSWKNLPWQKEEVEDIFVEDK